MVRIRQPGGTQQVPARTFLERGERRILQPLVVDLDGTLIHTDMLHESALKLLRNAPWDVIRIPIWLLRGKSALKHKLAGRTEFDPRILPYNQDLLSWLKLQKAENRRLILCTASDLSVAQAIADHLQIFDEVMASDGNVNLSGERKAEALEQRFGRGGFDYVGNSSKDLAIWRRAHSGIVVNASGNTARKAGATCDVERVFAPKPTGLGTWRRALRIHQWLKNLLLFVPFLAAHRVTNAAGWADLTLAFFAFSLCASAVYLANDLTDLESDRLHPRKRLRPFAAGELPTWTGAVAAPVLLAASLMLAWLVGGRFIVCLLVYFAVTSAYSLGLKRLLLIDCLTLAMLYTLRIVAGAAAAHMDLSFWLLAFSVFLFLSLAFVKRYAELEVQLQQDNEKVHGRGYYTSDAPLIQTLGVTSGFAAVVVLALYLNSNAVVQLYRSPEIVWGAVPVVLFWVSWMWMQAHRGNMHDDPLIFAIKDKASLLAGIAFAVILLIGTVGLPW